MGFARGGKPKRIAMQISHNLYTQHTCTQISLHMLLVVVSHNVHAQFCVVLGSENVLKLLKVSSAKNAKKPQKKWLWPSKMNTITVYNEYSLFGLQLLSPKCFFGGGQGRRRVLFVWFLRLLRL